MTDIMPLATITGRIQVIRGVKVMLDADLVELYGVATKRLNEQVRRNCERFPTDFLFRLNKDEHERLRSRAMAAAILNTRRGTLTGRRGPSF